MESGHCMEEIIPMQPLSPSSSDMLSSSSDVLRPRSRDTLSGDDPRNAVMERALKNLDVLTVEQLLAEEPSLSWRKLCYGETSGNNAPTALNVICDEYRENNDMNKRSRIFQAIWKEVEINRKKEYVLNHMDHKCRSHLYQAINSGHLGIVQELVDAGADVRKLHKDLDPCGPFSPSCSRPTALHAAVKHPHILRYFLQKLSTDTCKQLAEVVNKSGYAPIHFAAWEVTGESMKLLLDKFGEYQLSWRVEDGLTILHLAAMSGSETVVQLLFNYTYPECDVSCVDRFGYTPLIYSTEDGHEGVTAMLLDRGAVLSEKELNGLTALENIATTFIEPKKFLEDLFDKYIVTDGKRFKIDYRVFTKDNGRSLTQIKLLEKIIGCGLSDLLTHPLLRSLIYLKWRCLIKLFYVTMILYAIFLVSFNTFVVHMFYQRDKYNSTSTVCTSSPNVDQSSCFKCFDKWNWTWVTIISISYFFLVLQECLYVYLQKRRYFFRLESWVKLCMLALAPVVLGMHCVEGAWLRHVACVALLLSWMEAMFLTSQFRWGYYVLMFERVAYNLLKVLLALIWWIVGFAACFMILYYSKPPFDGIYASFVKTLVMMSSEFDYQNLFDADHVAFQDTRPVFRLLFVIFVIFIAIVLMNFMIGVAVSDANELKVIGNVKRLEKQVELLSTFDIRSDSELVKLFPRLSRPRFHSYVCKRFIDKDAKCEVGVGTSSYEQYFSSNLQKAITNVAKKHARREKIDRMERSGQGVKLDTFASETKEDSLKNSVNEIMRCIDTLQKDVDTILATLASDTRF